jgi:hypothetical protein
MKIKLGGSEVLRLVLYAATYAAQQVHTHLAARGSSFFESVYCRNMLVGAWRVLCCRQLAKDSYCFSLLHIIQP